MNNKQLILNSENVARLLCKDWVYNGIILHVAFTLRENETYISVNRLSESSYDSDVFLFIKTHPDFYSSNEQVDYYRALINVGDVRDIKVIVDGTLLNIDVNVEPRNTFTQSHAGIFTRHEGRNLKRGGFFYVKAAEKGISSDLALLKIRARLLDIAQLETSKVVKV